ncbi:MAG: hypothetical protein L6R38_002060 [Xanthoria sp. 2 TBL-2021]|nr:MAG: hypothetical protein L6R38_002060 [Xanthoria sp. 2 TBL-2021]
MEPSHIFGRNNFATEIQVSPEKFWLGRFRERYRQYVRKESSNKVVTLCSGQRRFRLDSNHLSNLAYKSESNMDATSRCDFVPNGLHKKSISLGIGPESHSPQQQPSFNTETEIHHPSEPNAVEERPTIVSGRVDSAQAIPSVRKGHYHPVDNAHLTRFAAKCHPDADAVCSEVDAFFTRTLAMAKRERSEGLLLHPSGGLFHPWMEYAYL